MNQAKGKLNLMSLEAQAVLLKEIDFVTLLVNANFPTEITSRLSKLLSATKKIGEQVIHIGKIILMKVLDFVKENPNLSIGIAVGLSLSIISGLLSITVPFIGTWLSTIVTPLVAMITVPAGLLYGHRLDKIIESDGEVGNSLVMDLITATKLFWALLVDIFSSVKDAWSDN